MESTQEPTVRCPYCAETILAAARKCKHCGEYLDPVLREARETAHPTPVPARTWSPGAAAVLSLFLPGAGQIYKGQLGKGFLWLIATAIGYTMLIVPGVLLHLICIVNAYTVDPRPDS